MPEQIRFACREVSALVLCLSTAIIGSGAFFAAPCRGLEKESCKVFHLRQHSDQSGNIESVIAEDFSRYDSQNNGMSFIVNGKNGEITILSHRKKQYWIANLAKWAPNSSYVNNILSFNDYNDLLPTSIAPDQSFKAFKLPTQLEKFKNPHTFTSSGKSKEEKLTLTSADIVTSPLLTSNKLIIRAATRIFSIAPSRAYPLVFTYTNRKLGVHQTLRTAGVEQTTAKSQLFKIPTDYKLAVSERDVYLDNAGHDTLEDILK